MLYCFFDCVKKLSRFLIGLALTVLMTHSLGAEQFKLDDLTYIGGSLVSVRTQPQSNAPVAGKIPIGTEVIYWGTPAEVVQRPAGKCMGAELKNDRGWSCICLAGTTVDYGVSWCGWVSTDLLVSKKPVLSDIMAAYEKTPLNDLAGRKKWAERAVGLDSSNTQAKEKLISVLEKINDVKGVETVVKYSDLYAVNQPLALGGKLLFQFGRGFLEPVAELKNGNVIFRDFDKSIDYKFYGRGQLYDLYSQGVKVGVVMTEAQFNCRIQPCPNSTVARPLKSVEGMDVVHGFATNAILVGTSVPTRKATQNDEVILQKLGVSFVKSSILPSHVKKALLASIQKSKANSVLAVGALDKDSRVMLIGGWEVGSMNDEHYGDESAVYESILFIAEQQKDGTFRLAPGSGSIAEHGCSYADHLDIDGDGTDEIILFCNQLEGQYSYAVAKRTRGGKWQIAYGPGRN